MNLPSLEIYDDDRVRFPDCAIEHPQARAFAEMLFRVGRQEKLSNLRPPHLLMNWNPRKVIQASRAYAVNDSRSALIAFDQTSKHLVFIWSDENEDNAVSKLVSLVASHGGAIGTLVYDGDAIIPYPENSDCPELRDCQASVLAFIARFIIFARAANPQLQAANALFEVTNLDEYSEWSDKYGHDALLDPIQFPVPNTDNGFIGEAI